VERTVRVKPIGERGAQVVISVCESAEAEEEIVLELFVSWDLYVRKKRYTSIAEAVKFLRSLSVERGGRLLENMLTGGVESVWRDLEEIYAPAKS